MKHHAVAVAVAVAAARRNEDLRLFCLVECDTMIDRDTFLSKINEEKKRKGKEKEEDLREGGTDIHSIEAAVLYCRPLGTIFHKEGHTRCVLTARRYRIY